MYIIGSTQRFSSFSQLLTICQAQFFTVLALCSRLCRLLWVVGLRLISCFQLHLPLSPGQGMYVYFNLLIAMTCSLVAMASNLFLLVIKARHFSLSSLVVFPTVLGHWTKGVSLTCNEKTIFELGSGIQLPITARSSYPHTTLSYNANTINWYGL